MLTFPDAGAGGASSTFFSINLANGRGYMIDRLTSDPLNLRSRTLEENLFAVIGRSTGQAAATGEIFFAPIASTDGSVRAALYVESPIGYAAFFEEPGRGRKLGKIITLTDRPFADIATTDGNYALLMRHDSSGRTEGAYLYHATSGRGLYRGGLRRLEASVGARPTSPLPALAGRVTAAEIHVDSESTSSYLVADPASGQLHFLSLTSEVPTRVTPRQSSIQLYDAFSREGGHTSPRRFLAVPINAGRTLTRQVFIADAVTGETAVLENVTDANAEMGLAKGVSVNRWLRAEGGERVFAAVPRVTGSGATIGVWLLDSQSRSTVYIDNPGLAAEMTATRVTIELK